MKSYLISLILPLNLCVFIVSIGTLFAIFRRFRTALLCILLGVFWVFIWSLPITSILVGGYLEYQYPYQEASRLKTAQAIVVFGGNTASHRKNWFEPFNKKNLHSRIDTADKLFFERKAPLIILSGGDLNNHISEAEKMAFILQHRGIPSAAIITETQSETTRKNGLYVLTILQKRHINNILLVTSALHMPRAMAVMRKLNINAIAAPNPPQIVIPKHKPFNVWLPSSRALEASRSIIKEYIGIIVYWLRGWI